jgi:16S rRNA (cytosine967-C5)-methyltransferase
MPVSPARAAAFDILLRVERESSYASELLHSASYENLSHSDHALTTELVMGVLRWRSRLDEEIAGASSQPLVKLDIEILIALRLALYQFRWLTRVPARAALHESVELVKRARKRSAAPFVNAVLRKLSAKTSENRSVSDDQNSSPEILAAAFSHPVWLIERWVQEFGSDATHRICQYDQSVPSTTIRLRTPEAASELAAEGLSLSPGEFLSSARRVEAGDITATQAFRQGRVVIQDEGSQLVAALLGRGDQGEGDCILDCCAAPGGKTLAIADRNPGSVVTAVEVHSHRARLMKKLLPSTSNMPSAHIRVVVGDARHLPVSQTYNRILADVPCSGTGTLSRNPEIKWRLTHNDLQELRERQLGILRSALNHLAPGGRLVYSTCSLEREENEAVVETILAENKSFRLVHCAAEMDRLRVAGELLPQHVPSLTREPYLHTIPGIHPCDGFFAAIIERA